MSPLRNNFTGNGVGTTKDLEAHPSGHHIIIYDAPFSTHKGVCAQVVTRGLYFFCWSCGVGRLKGGAALLLTS